MKAENFDRMGALDLLEQEFQAISYSLGEGEEDISPLDVIQKLKKSKFEIGNPNNYLREVELNSDSNFQKMYLMKIPLLLYPMQDHVFNRLNLSVEVLSDSHNYISVVSIFPRQDYKEILKLDAQFSANGKMSLEPDFFSIFNSPDMPLENTVNASVSGKIRVESVGISIGNLNIVAQHSDRKAMWRFLSSSSINGDSELQVLLLIGIRSDIKKFELNIEGSACMSYDWIKFKFSSFLKSLPNQVKSIFFSDVLDLGVAKSIEIVV